LALNSRLVPKTGLLVVPVFWWLLVGMTVGGVTPTYGFATLVKS